MAGAHINFQLGPDTRVVSPAATGGITGGQLVMPDTANPGMVVVASAAATTVLGVARSDGAPRTSSAPINYGAVSDRVGVIYGPADVDVVYATNCADGQLVIAAANGQVGAAGVAPASDQVIGRCTQPGGVISGAVGRVRLR